MSMRAAIRLLTICTAGVAVLAVAMPAANAGYPFKCPKNTVLVLEHDDPSPTNPTPVLHAGPTAIQDAIETADGLTVADTDPANPVPDDSGGDTVIICSGTYMENVDVPFVDPGMGGNNNSNITIRSFDDGSVPVIVGAPGVDPVFDINAPGVLLGGTHLGFRITGQSQIGIRVTDPTTHPGLDDNDDQEITECNLVTGECPDEERAPFLTNNVSIIGNDIEGLSSGTGSFVTGIAVSNTNNTLVFRNKIQDLSAGPGDIAYGIRYSGTNYNNQVISNAVKDLSQTGGGCTGTLAEPEVGAVGVGIQDEALDAMVHRTLVEDISSSCTAIGVYSNAWGGLENTRNGQQVPIVTDVLDNRIKKVKSSSTDANPAAGVALAPLNPPANADDENDTNEAPSSFRVLANDIDDTAIAVAVLLGMAPNSYIRENDLDHDQIGVLNATEFNVDATNNWWGCDEGPFGGKKACSTISNTGTGSTSFVPWLKHHASHAGAHAGEFAGH